MQTTFLDLVEELGVEIDPELLDLALTHRSWAYENGQVPHNERLEFLGDSVLGITVTRNLFQINPELPEGDMSRIRAKVVSAVSLAEVARGLGIGSMLKLGRGEISTGGDDKTSILADTTEALIGAMYLTAPEGATRFVEHLFLPLIAQARQPGGSIDRKAALVEYCQLNGVPAPEYRIEESGPDHDKRFFATVFVDGKPVGKGSGTTKRHAEIEAATEALEALDFRGVNA